MFKILKFSKELWPYYAVIAGLTVIIALLSQVRPFMIKAIVDELSRSLEGVAVSAQRVLVIIGIFVASRMVVSLLNDITGYLGDMMSIRLQRILSQRYYQHLLRLPQTFFDDELSGKLINRLNRSIFEISNFIQAFSNNFLSTILTALISMSIIAYYSPLAAGVLAILFPVYFYLTKKASKVFKEKQDIINQHVDEAQGRFAEVIGQIRVVKSYVRERSETSVFTKRYHKAQATKKEQSWHWHSYNLARNVAFDIALAGAVGLVGWQALKGRYTIGEFTLLLQLVIEVSFPLFFISFLMDSLQRAQANSKDYFKIMAEAPEVADSSSKKALKVSQGAIEYQNVTFGYNKNAQVIQDVSFKIKPGTKLALIGQSGEGKSTIANLLLRLYSPHAGKILIDGTDISQVNQKSLRNQVGVVFQDALLFSGTVKENIAYAKPSATASEIKAAARVANAAAFIRKLPRGYDTKIGERGIKLSGGQKQRIAIARAMLKNPPILILDEATSSLDSKAEAEVQRALRRLMNNRTSLIIAHRLSTIKDVDLVVSLQKGRVVEIGTPAELAAAAGIYAELLRLQYPTFANKKKLKQFELVSR